MTQRTAAADKLARMSKGPRKLLVAAIGVATINYLTTACGKTPTSGNLPAPQPTDQVPVTGNLPAPPPQDAAPPEPTAPPITGNAPVPSPPAQDAAKPKGTKK